MAEPGGEVFLELKKKYKGIVYKRRITLPEDAAGEFIAGRAPLGEHGQIGREIEYFTSIYAPLRPAVHLSYERSAWFSREDRDLRITFDRSIRFRHEDVLLTLPAAGWRILPEGESLMEIKATAALPLWLVAELDALGIYQRTFSKYGEAYKTILADTRETFGGKTA